jgi:hypothetical protein
MIHRTFKTLALAVALSAAASGAMAQDFVFSWSPRTGDVWMDNRLSDMNDYGYRYREPFINEMTRYYGAPRDLVSDLLINRRWAPGDVYYACSIAQILGRPCRYVVDEWDRNHGQGWGVVAQRLGIKPGSAEFHRLKRGFVPTYDRWSRPITLDRDLERDFPNRGNKGHAGHASDKGKPAHAGGGNSSRGKSDARPGNSGSSGKAKGQGGKPSGNKGGQGKGNGGGKGNGKG